MKCINLSHSLTRKYSNIPKSASDARNYVDAGAQIRIMEEKVVALVLQMKRCADRLNDDKIEPKDEKKECEKKMNRFYESSK